MYICPPNPKHLKASSHSPLPITHYLLPITYYLLPITYLQSKKPTPVSPTLFPCSLLKTSDDLDYYTATENLECHL
ncbi:hypothetical protein [Moorena sp. SIO3A5]|uniref:hypothetical protein n=1 Tax=Moorena sp. SIO3A5 TaxID=2607822 RepID=UPI001375E416|nr:hypothetical protein [Moorena sp. SIO3A5]NEP33272.1 hypothetical protein [Moorena sp. SIO3B2]